MEPVSGDEVKLRIWELPQGQRTVVPYDTLFYGDGPLSGPNYYEPQDIISSSVKRITARTGAPPPASKLLVIPPGDGSAHLYDLTATTGASASYYLGPSAAPPTTDHQGLAVVPGHSYFNTTDNQMYNYTSAGQWVLAGQPIPSSIRTYVYHIVVDTNLIPLLDDFGRALDYDPDKGDAVTLYLNGSRQVGGIDFILHDDKTITLPVPMLSGNVVEIQILGRPVVSFLGTPIVVNDALWVFNGTTKTFPIKAADGTVLAPASPAACLVSINGRILDPTSEYTVSGGQITFTTAPVAASPSWMTVQLTDPQRRAVIVNTSSGGLAIGPQHNGCLIENTVACTVTVPTAAVLGAGFRCEVAAPASGTVVLQRASGGTANITSGNSAMVSTVGAVVRSTLYASTVL